MATVEQWVHGARPRTLPAAIASVLVGTGSAIGIGRWDAGLALLALLVALFLQIGVNYANDYSDGIRGTDHERVGPIRLVGQGLAQPVNVKLAAFACFGMAALAGLVLTGLSGVWWLPLVGIAAIAAAWFYTGGDRPYGYAGLGEVFVFVFFGLVATLGTTYTQALTLDAGSILGAVAIGSLITAVLVVNNLRDRAGDEAVGKRTLAVRLGDRATRWFFAGLFVVAAGCVLAAGLILGKPSVFLGLIGLAAGARPVRTVLSGAAGKALIPPLSGTGVSCLVFGVLLAVGLALA